MKVQRMLVPIDGSEGAQAALDYAITLRKGHPAEIVVVLALEPVHLRVGAQITRASENVRMVADEQRLIAEQQLGRLESDLRKRGLPATTVIATGKPDEVILATAKKHKCDLIIMSTHGRAGIAHAILGSVTEKVIRGSNCPVVTVRGYDKKSKKKR